MSRKYEELTGIELIKGFCYKIVVYGVRNGLDTDGIKLWVSPIIAKALELEEVLIVKYGNCTYEIPVIIDDSIMEIPLGNRAYQSDVWAGNLEWKIDRAEGELWSRVAEKDEPK